MSIDAVVSRIDQIYTLQQQVADPAAFVAQAGSTASASGATATAPAQSTTGTSSSDFASLLASAQAQGATGATDPTSTALTDAGLTSTGLTSTGLTNTGLLTAGATGTTAATTAGAAVSPADPRITAMVQQANSLIGKPYVWGGGHSDWGTQTGYDCSGFVSAVLHAGGYLSSPQDTQTLPSQAGIEQGPGQYVTIYDRTDAGSSDHVIISINGQFYESGGESGSWGGGGGVAKIGTPSAAYLATFNDVLHPAGL